MRQEGLLGSLEVQIAVLAERIAGQQVAVQAALAAAEKATSKAEVAMERRFDSVNEFRGTLADQQAHMMPREEVLVMERAVMDKIADLKQQVDRLVAERAGIQGGWGYAVGVIGLVLAILAFGLRAYGR